MAEWIVHGQIDDVWQDLVVAILSVNQYSLADFRFEAFGLRSALNHAVCVLLPRRTFGEAAGSAGRRSELSSRPLPRGAVQNLFGFVPLSHPVALVAATITAFSIRKRNLLLSTGLGVADSRAHRPLRPAMLLVCEPDRELRRIRQPIHSRSLKSSDRNRYHIT